MIINNILKITNNMKQSSSSSMVEQQQAMRFVWLKDDVTLFSKVKQNLIKLAQKKCTSSQIICMLDEFHACTLTYRQYSKHNSHQSANYDMLHKIYGKQLSVIFAHIAQYILKSNNNAQRVSILRIGQNRKQFISKSDGLLMLCLMATMLVPPQHYENIKQIQGNFHHIRNFQHIFTHQNFKTRTIIQYIRRQLTNYNKNKSYSNGKQQEWLIIERVSLNGQPYQIFNQLINKNTQRQMGALSIRSDQTSIQQFYGHYKTDFANKYIGGGALTRGLVQQQIMFAVHPQMYISMPICQRMTGTQAIRFYGFQKYFQTQGYSNIELIGYNKKCDQPEYIVIQGRKVVKEYITAIDAVNFNRNYDIDQYSQQCIIREIVKAYAGFNWQQSSSQKTKGVIVSGNWGCGVFGGNVQLKTIIQWIAASLANKNLLYCPFGSKNKVYNQKLLQKIGKCNVKQVLKCLIKAGQEFSKGQEPKRYSLRSAQTKPIPTIYSLMQEYL